MKNCWSFSSFLTSLDKVSLYNGLSCPETHFFEEEHSGAGAASCPGLQPLRHEHTQAAFLSVFTFSLLLPLFTSPSVFCKAESHTIVTVAVKDSLIFTMLPRWPQTMVILLPQSLDSWIVMDKPPYLASKTALSFKKIISAYITLNSYRKEGHIPVLTPSSPSKPWSFRPHRGQYLSQGWYICLRTSWTFLLVFIEYLWKSLLHCFEYYWKADVYLFVLL